MTTTAPAQSLPFQLSFSWAEPEAPSQRNPHPQAHRPPSTPRVTAPARQAAPCTPNSRLAKTTHVSELMELVLARYGISREEIEAELARC